MIVLMTRSKSIKFTFQFRRWRKMSYEAKAGFEKEYKSKTKASLNIFFV